MGAAARPGDAGLVTLEWLLIFAAVAGLAASSVLAVQTVVDGASDVPDDPAVRVIDADIAAAFIAAEADEAVLSPPYFDVTYEERCETGLPAAYGDVVDRADWTMPQADGQIPPALLHHARCVVTPKAGLGN